MEDQDTTVKKPRTKKPVAVEPVKDFRRFKGQSEMMHDVYRLEEMPVQKNVSYIGAQPRYESFPHAHVFHTIDSNGRPQKYCAKIGGHFHEITIVDHQDGKKPEVTCGPAMKWVSQWEEHNGMKRKILVEAVIKEDPHTHPLTYLHSEVLKPKKLSSEFVKFQSAHDSKRVTSVEGVA